MRLIFAIAGDKETPCIPRRSAKAEGPREAGEAAFMIDEVCEDGGDETGAAGEGVAAGAGAAEDREGG